MPGLLVTALAISAVAALLALLLEAADAVIADYGERRIVVNDEREFQVRGGRTLLSTLAEEKIFLPSACGGKGTCAYCKVRVLEGGGPLLPTETPYLSPDERGTGVRISCQIKVKKDLRIEVPADALHVTEFDGVVEAVETLTPDIKLVRFRLMTPDVGIRFRPGQYVQLEIPPSRLSGQAEFRAYSIASAASQHHRIELVITRVDQGIVSNYVHDELRVNDGIRLRGPFGEFYLRPGDRDLLFVATGSGVAPFRSILRQMVDEGIDRRAVFFFGDRRPHDLLFPEEFRDLEKQLPGFRYVPTLSRVVEGDRWEGERGRVTDLIDRHIPQGAPIDAYICGAPAMVHSVIERLGAKGIPEERIFFDNFE